MRPSGRREKAPSIPRSASFRGAISGIAREPEPQERPRENGPQRPPPRVPPFPPRPHRPATTGGAPQERRAASFGGVGPYRRYRAGGSSDLSEGSFGAADALP